MAGIEMLHVPYKGDGPGIVDLIAGRVDLQFSLVTVSLRHIRAGNLRPLAVGSAKRSPLLPDVPTFAEAGFPDFVYSSWVCIFAPGGTPKSIIDTLNREVVKAVNSPTVSSNIIAAGAEPTTSSPEELRDFVKSEIAKWGAVVKRAGVKAD
jgi:tripartite-type tricarboxylate transporter receptor subunit TctC